MPTTRGQPPVRRIYLLLLYLTRAEWPITRHIINQLRHDFSVRNAVTLLQSRAQNDQVARQTLINLLEREGRHDEARGWWSTPIDESATPSGIDK